ncbi:RagB/SusD family nutrient uptake outer membrane protein [Rhodohalobacter sp. 614A]|uniref:RagB/SusD family nutrient uptake outer membrane protein n=1 Tax=Rhodohalobacter sp. 614A TaxID=2908649 RepID=UPI001F16EC2C|nr:RagB/SusD family nutrient uptake outer membrane protein [Rhodohalobacter sp. 614A]
MKTRYLLIFVLSLAAIVSCDLQEEPYGFYSEDNFFQSPSDAEAAVVYAYDALTYLEYSRGVFWLGDLPTDEMTPKNDEGPDVIALSQWNTANFPTNSNLENYFQYAYIAINRANAVLGQVPEAGFDQASKDKYMGEAYFLRAWNYFNLVRNFGRIPMHTSSVKTLDQTSAPMAENLDEVYDLIISDLEQSIDLLTIDPMLGRADKVASQSLLAKVYLTIASAKENGVPEYAEMQKNVDEMYSMAADYSDSVVNGQGTYGFDSDLLSIYDVSNPMGPEHILLMSMDRTGDIEGEYSKISKLFIPYIDGATIYLSDNDGTFTRSHDGWSSMQTRPSFYDSFDGSDKRKSVMIVDTTYNQNGEVSATYPGSILYPFSRKYVDPEFIGDKTSTKPYLIRYSDIALVYAEAVGPTSEGYAQVNYIRNRAGLGNLQPGLNMEQFREAVLEERKYELAFEGNRLYDLKRFNLINDLVPEAAGLSDEEVAFYPIPQTEIDLNQGL